MGGVLILTVDVLQQKINLMIFKFCEGWEEVLIPWLYMKFVGEEDCEFNEVGYIQIHK